MGDVNQARPGYDSKEILLAPRFGVFHVSRRHEESRFELAALVPEIRSPYADVKLVDVNGDGRSDLIASSGEIYFRHDDGGFPARPSLRLAPAEVNDWTFLAVGDFNADRRPDIALCSYGMRRAAIAVYYHQGQADVPYKASASATIDLEEAIDPRQRHSLLRDTPPVADWDGDGVDDLFVGKGQDQRVLVLLGGSNGLDRTRSDSIPLEFRLHFETRLHVADFDGDHRVDLAAFGDTKTGVGAGGPPAVYLWTRSNRASDRDQP
jgi:hypothetical protein